MRLQDGQLDTQTWEMRHSEGRSSQSLITYTFTSGPYSRFLGNAPKRNLEQ